MLHASGLGQPSRRISATTRLFQLFNRYAGAAYVVNLALELARAGVLVDDAAAKPANIKDGVILLSLIPKAYLIVSLMFTEFTGARDLDRSAFVLRFALVFTINNAVAFSLYAALSSRAPRVPAGIAFSAALRIPAGRLARTRRTRPIMTGAAPVLAPKP
ncbi:hypothetical protein SAMN04488020_11011 [Palleronia marisminoris]|uniref:Uncharacterized protein n=1 Tax=Palleronia marisminoris TaxID=315423 RepID=A0A1Y5TDS1_9RHOB|nr:hypothetical protein [Palleronia marisminoris]SFH31941.1 hypothetical protein SAMN04488020_11011 [Palleronia marisminoris]SLN61419.1 hypothetical protein PAM7066_03067 [Palleronia marisminoris]